MSHIELMRSAVLQAGEYMRGSVDHARTEKTNAKDFATVADIKSQDIVRKKLESGSADVVVLSEEDSEEKRRAMFEAAFTGYIIDPIDGTYNFSRGMQESAISIGKIEKGVAVAGAIYDPYKQELFETELGTGARLNGQPISVSTRTELVGASIATSNSYDDEAMKRNLLRHLAIYEKTGTMPWTSCPGSGVLIMAWVASGRIDAYHHNGLKPWDNAAAFLLVREAGGEVQTLTGEQANFTSPTVLMGNRAIVQAMRQVFDQVPAELLS